MNRYRVEVYRQNGWWWYRLVLARSGWVEYLHPFRFSSAKHAADAGRSALATRLFRHGWTDLSDREKALALWTLGHRMAVYRPEHQPQLPISRGPIDFAGASA